MKTRLVSKPQIEINQGDHDTVDSPASAAREAAYPAFFHGVGFAFSAIESTRKN
ncbi:hypothetical protein [Aureimonas fodinaquatilis]|uniref:hypothetical protein n=1 Tax=Aureimonas fodinaquatilis TaxID=2565783 RepID=UPI00165D8470|nr:hypothetical protein [Aureimonas fodinaquatilis]